MESESARVFSSSVASTVLRTEVNALSKDTDALTAARASARIGSVRNGVKSAPVAVSVLDAADASC
jgi:hypothetical protein